MIKSASSVSKERAPKEAPGLAPVPAPLHREKLPESPEMALLRTIEAAIKKLQYPELLYSLLKVGPDFPMIKFEFDQRFPTEFKEAVRAYAGYHSLGTRAVESREGPVRTALYVYDPNALCSAIKQLRNAADENGLGISPEKMAALPLEPHAFVKAITAKRSDYWSLLFSILEGGISGRSVDQEIKPEKLSPLNKQIFDLIYGASVAGQTKGLAKLNEDFCDLLRSATADELVRLYRAILRSKYRDYDQALQSISQNRLRINGINPYGAKGSICTKEGEPYTVSLQMSGTFSTEIQLPTDRRVSLDLPRQQELVEQRLVQWKVVSCQDDGVLVEAEAGSEELLSDVQQRRAAKSLSKGGTKPTLLDLESERLKESLKWYGKVILVHLDLLKEALQPSLRRELTDLLFSRWADEEDHYYFIAGKHSALAGLLGAKPEELFLGEEQTRDFWAATKVTCGAGVLTRLKAAVSHKLAEAPVKISKSELAEALAHAQISVEQMKHQVAKHKHVEGEFCDILKPDRASSYGYIGLTQQLKYQLAADYLTFKRAGLDIRAVGELLAKGLSSLKVDKKLLDQWQTIAPHIQMLEPGIRARQSHVSPFYGPVWVAFGERCAPDFLVRNDRLPGFQVSINAEGIHLAKDFAFLQGEKFCEDTKSWRALDFRVNAADLASVIKGKLVEEVRYSQVAEADKAFQGGAKM